MTDARRDQAFFFFFLDTPSTVWEFSFLKCYIIGKLFNNRGVIYIVKKYVCVWGAAFYYYYIYCGALLRLPAYYYALDTRIIYNNLLRAAKNKKRVVKKKKFWKVYGTCAIQHKYIYNPERELEAVALKSSVVGGLFLLDRLWFTTIPAAAFQKRARGLAYIYKCINSDKGGDPIRLNTHLSWISNIYKPWNDKMQRLNFFIIIIST